MKDIIKIVRKHSADLICFGTLVVMAIILSGCAGSAGSRPAPPPEARTLDRQVVEIQLRLTDDGQAAWLFKTEDGVCHIEWLAPDQIPQSHLVGYVNGTDFILWRDLGQRVWNCATADWVATLDHDAYPGQEAYFTGKLTIDTVRGPLKCGKGKPDPSTLGCYSHPQGHIRIVDGLDRDTFLSVLGHEVWHAVAGDFHPEVK